MNNNVNGQGTLTYANGDIYVGHFVNNQFNGQGTLTFINGDIYVGHFVNGQVIGNALRKNRGT